MTIVVGAGAAGLVAAIFARASGDAVTLIEKTKDGGRKILISGGGRCNVLPQALEPERFITNSPAALLRRMLRSWPLHEQIEFFERDVGIPLKLESESRKYFPESDRARDVRDGLVALAQKRGVECAFDNDLTGLVPAGTGWRVETSLGSLEATRVILATGGLSVPATGSDGAGLRVATDLGHVVHETYPALTPLVAMPSRHGHLSGVSLDVRLRARWRGKIREARGGFLFTHKGYSGPAVLDMSDVAVRSARSGSGRATVRVQWCDAGTAEWDAALRSAQGPVLGVLSRRLPLRLSEQIAHECGVPSDRRVAELRRSERVTLVERLTSYELSWTGDEGYKKAEVTGGGVALDAVNPRTLESRRHPGLFFCGEMLDAFGPIGGHNFAWAWSTGRLAGVGRESARERLS